MNVNTLIGVMYATTSVNIYDIEDGFYRYSVYEGYVYNIPDEYLERDIDHIDSETESIAIILESEEVC